MATSSPVEKPDPSEARSRADWRRVEEVYAQVSSIVGDEEQRNHLPRRLAGLLGESLGRVFASYDGAEAEFVQDALEILSAADGRKGRREQRFRDLYHDARFDRLPDYGTGAHERRRRPRPFEALVETARRIRDLNRVRDQLLDIPTSCILGGSASYGRFFNTVGAKEANPSDVDLLLVVRTYDDLPKLADELAKVTGLTGTEEMRERAESFTEACGQLSGDARCIFSHKLQMWEQSADPMLDRTQVPAQYKLSTHTATTDDFDYLTLRDMPSIDEGLVRELWDYRQDAPARQDNQRCFAGLDQGVDREYKSVAGGHLAESRVCHVTDERFYPGLHQNLILPQFDLRWEMTRRRLTLPLFSFRWKIVERLRLEKTLRPFEYQTISLSHTRSAFFAPHIERRVDAYE